MKFEKLNKKYQVVFITYHFAHQSHGLNKFSTSNVGVAFIVLAIIIDNKVSLHTSIIHFLRILEMPSRILIPQF